MSRAERILGRFPAHFEAARAGKLLGAVAAALARDLDVQSAQLAGIRRAHRVREADTVGDLMRIGALHGIRLAEVDLLLVRLGRAAERAAALADAAPADRPALAGDLLALWALDLPDEPLAAFTPDPAPGDAEAAAVAVLVDAAAAAGDYRTRRRALSRRIVEVCRNHAEGNGTVRALLAGAANALDLDILATHHSDDRFLHAAEVVDRLALVPAPESGIAAPPRLTEVLGLEENPLRRAEQAPVERRHAECFEILRKGFAPARLEISVTPEGHRGVGPMVVNRDQGRGVGYAGTIPPGETLVFSETGRATIGGADVTAFAYGFEGAVFADAEKPAEADARFDEAAFAVATPAGALDRDFAFPHAGLSIPMPHVAIGRTRMAFFVQEGHFAAPAAPPDRPAPLTPAPRPTAGLFAGPGAPLGSVFAPGPDETRDPAALVGFAWREHEAYKVRVLIPPRFRALSDEPEGVEVTRRVTDALERFRPAGVAVETAFIDERWTLGEAALGGAEGAPEPLLALGGGTVLWATGDESDPPGQGQ